MVILKNIDTEINYYDIWARMLPDFIQNCSKPIHANTTDGPYDSTMSIHALL